MPNLRVSVACSTLAVLLAIAAACGGGKAAPVAPGQPIPGIADRPVRVTTTTNFITDLARTVGGDRVDVAGLMGPGVDPHLYKASAGDVAKLEKADLILYGGLELEGRMTDLFVEMAAKRLTVPVTRDLPREELLEPSAFAGKYDPHVWFDPALWSIAAGTVAESLAQIDPEHADDYRERAEAYQGELDALDAYIVERVRPISKRSRLLVTSHDAFNYFGLRYGFDVEAIQGISTATEATTADIERIARLIAERRVKAVFIESSVPRQTIDAVIAAAADRGWKAKVGGQLFSDSAGAEGTEEATLVGMLRHNVDTIVEGLR